MQIVKIGGEGLHKSELKAIDKFETVLQPSWYGYAGIVLTDSQGSMEIDCLIITQDRILIVELKEWNGTLTSHDGKWFINGKPRGKSPYLIKREHAQRIRKILVNELSYELKGYEPHVEAHVVLCGSSTKDGLTLMEKEYVHSLDDFLQISNKYEDIVQKTKFNHIFKSKENPNGYERPNAPDSNTRRIFEKFFRGTKVKELTYSYQDYVASSEFDFKHPEDLFKEYRSVNNDLKEIGLLRRWNFDSLGGKYASKEIWENIVLREQRLRVHVEKLNESLTDFLMNPLLRLGKDDVANDMSELYQLRATEKRLSNIITELKKYDDQKIFDLIRNILKPISDLHNLNICHRDLTTDNIWYSKASDKIIFSQFSSSFFEERGTISDYRDKIKTQTISIPEEYYDDIKDPFRIDVFSLGVICYFILSKGYNLKTDGDNIPLYIELPDYNNEINLWIETSLNITPTERYANAYEMLNEFNKIAQPIREDSSKYIYNEIINSGIISEKSLMDIFLLSNNKIEDANNCQENNYGRFKIEYKNKICVLKFWIGINIDEKKLSECRKVLNFKNSIEKIKYSNINSPSIIEYGYISAGGVLYFIYEYIEGETIDNYFKNDLQENIAENLAIKLINNIQNLHHLGIYHGDLHPENIIVNNNELYLIDLVDISLSTEKYNVEYSPKNPASTTGFGRDIYSTYKIIEKLFKNSINSKVIEEINLALESNESVPLSLDPLLNAIQNSFIINEDEGIYINHTPDLVIYTQNKKNVDKITPIDGKYLINFKEQKNDTSKIDFYITGYDYQLKATLHLDDKIREITKVFINEISFSEVVSAESKKDEEIYTNISIIHGSYNNSDLLEVLTGLDSFLDYLDEKYNHDNLYDNDLVNSNTDIKIPIEKIWTTLAETELETRHSIVIDGGDIVENNEGNFLIPYTTDSDIPLDFEADEIVKIYDAENRVLGDLIVQDTNSDFLVINFNKNISHKFIKKGDILFYESLRNKASRDRRHKALNRVINNNSVIRDISKYFDENNKSNYQAEFDELDKNNLIDFFREINEELSEEQIHVFESIMKSEPISVLQGPPGTGKTFFISQFVQYLFKANGVHNILLVSQSHTAVDNVISRCIQLSNKIGLNHTIIRIGQESMINEEILQYSIPSTQRQILNKFYREFEQRVMSLSSYLQLPDDFSHAVIKLHQLIGSIIQFINRLKLDITKERNSGNRAEVIEKFNQEILDKLNIISQILLKNYDYEVEFSAETNILEVMITHLAGVYNVNNKKEIKKLILLLEISDDWAAVLRTGYANFDQFLVKTKQLVCGTLVGIGKNNIQIENIEFDWVIIDEAARAQASELMIALQSAKRVLLVGDHKQLPPHYDKKHLKLASKKLDLPVNSFNIHDFERVFKNTNGVTLSTQYRMIEPICRVISNVFYSDIAGGLKTGRTASPKFYDFIADQFKESVIWVDSTNEQKEIKTNPGYCNEHEVKIIKDILQCYATESNFLENLISQNKPSNIPIGIITLYKSQKELIENMINQTDWLSSIRDLIKVDTVDSYQGQENDIIILSLVRDNHQGIEGFLLNPERINVSLSRAKERLIIIGASKMWSENNIDSPLNKVFNEIYQNAIIDPCNFKLIQSNK